MDRSFQESGKNNRASDCYYKEGEIYYNFGDYEVATLGYNRAITLMINVLTVIVNWSGVNFIFIIR